MALHISQWKKREKQEIGVHWTGFICEILVLMLRGSGAVSPELCFRVLLVF